MKSALVLIFLLSLSSPSSSQRRFIRMSTSVDFGSAIRIIPMNDQGWVIASLDSMRFSRFDRCGRIIWSKRYFVPNEEPLLNDIISLRSGDVLLLTRINTGNKYACLLTRLDTAGNFIWCKSYEDTYYDHFGYTLDEDPGGNIFLFANVDHVNGPDFNMICKFNSSGNILRTTFYDYGGTWGRALLTSDNGMLIRTGDLFIKTDAAGNVEWNAWGSLGGTTWYAKPVEVSDGYIYSKYLTATNQIVFFKITKQGVIDPGAVWVSDFTGKEPMLKVTAAGTIVALFNVGNSPTLVELDKNLNVLRQGSVNFGGLILNATDFCFSSGEAIIAGITSSSQMFFAKLDDLYKSSCDTIMPLMQLHQDTVFTINQTTNVSAYTLNEVDHVYSFVNIIDDEVTLCAVPLQLELGPDVTLCNSDTRLLRNNLLGLFNEYHWSTGETTSYININQGGKYWVEAIHYCEDSILTDTINITVDSMPEINFSDAMAECENNSVVLRAPLCNQCIYEWSTGDTTDSLIVSLPGHYTLKIESSNHCKTSDSVDVEFLLCECELYVPNTFSPNNDGVNEIFKPVYYCEMVNYEMTIFNRLGKIVYSSTNPEEGWNGHYKSSAGIEDVYNYTLQYTPVIKGKQTESIKKSGIVALIY